MYTWPPIPRDIWARIRMNHCAQTSVECLKEFLSQMDLGLRSDSAGGNPVDRLNELRANPTARALCVSPSIGKGHCVVPYRIEDNFGGDPDLSRIWIYDNEAPCSVTNSPSDACVTGQHIDVHRATNYFTFGPWTNNLMATVPVEFFSAEH